MNFSKQLGLMAALLALPVGLSAQTAPKVSFAPQSPPSPVPSAAPAPASSTAP